MTLCAPTTFTVPHEPVKVSSLFPPWMFTSFPSPQSKVFVRWPWRMPMVSPDFAVAPPPVLVPPVRTSPRTPAADIAAAAMSVASLAVSTASDATAAAAPPAFDWAIWLCEPGLEMFGFFPLLIVRAHDTWLLLPVTRSLSTASIATWFWLPLIRTEGQLPESVRLFELPLTMTGFPSQRRTWFSLLSSIWMGSARAAVERH